MPFNDPAGNLMLDSLDESVATGIKYVGIHTLADPGTSTNAAAGEATGGSPAYARQAVTWGASSGRVKSNTGALTFDVPAGTYGFLTFWNASTGNTNVYLGHSPMGGAAAVKGWFSVDTTLTNDQFFSVAHGLADGDRIQMFNTFAETLPTGVTEGTVYFIVNSATNTFKVSTTSGGSAVDITALGGGEGYYQKVVPETFNAQGQITVAAGALVLDATAV